MSDEETIVVKTIDCPDVSPRVALARLTSYTPGRGSFLLESLAPDTEDGRYSIVGYRVRSGASLPPAADVANELAELGGGEAQETLAQGLTMASVGYFDQQSMSRAKGVRLHPDMGSAGVFAVQAAVMLIDHHEKKAHVAGRTKGRAVDRLIWELEHADDVPAIEVTSGTHPKTVTPQSGAKKLKVRAGRLQSFIGDEIEAAVLAEEIVSALDGARPLDVYRALVALDQKRETPHTHGFFVDYGETPFGKHNRIAGLSSTSIHQARRGEDKDAWQAFQDALPSAQFHGEPAVEAARVLREVEDGGRLLWGDVVGYVCPGGESSWMLVEKGVVFNGDTFVCTVGVEVGEDTDGAGLFDRAMQNADDQLSALASAQTHKLAHPDPPAEPPQEA